MTDTSTTRAVRQAAFAVLQQFGFYRTSIEIWRNPSATSSPTPVGVVVGGIIPASVAASIGLPVVDDQSGARGEFTSYTYGGSITIQDGDELHLVENGGTLIYPVEGVSEWNVLQIGNLTTVRDASTAGTVVGGDFLMTEGGDYLMGS